MALAQASAQLHVDQVITQSLGVKPGIYRLANTDNGAKTAAITIRGNDIVVDFHNATLRGTDQDTAPDKREGTGILVEGNNVTLKNVEVTGYKLGIVARQCQGLKLFNCDLSYNWRQHLKSTPQAENEDDWMFYHHNEADDWLRYGAAAYLDGCTKFEVRGLHVAGGQCGVMLNRCDHGTVWNNTVHYMSGIGLGLYRSSDNVIENNALDYCVRGYSENVYNRGQDSAGILVYEQSNRNTFAYNSATHGGDGFFLWAGQSTMDSAEGGCNDNLVYGNDFSHAVANGIEATFSRNTFANNLVMDCWHGMWLGYSFESMVLGNVFRRNVEGVSWEHGANNKLAENVFDHDGVGIHVWANADKRADFAYSAKKNTDSTSWVFTRNVFNQVPTAFWVDDTKGAIFDSNHLGSVTTTVKSSQLTGATSQGNIVNAPEADWPGDDGSNILHHSPTAVPDGAKTSIKDNTLQTWSEYAQMWTAPWTSGFDGRFPEGDALLLQELQQIAPTPMQGGMDPFMPYHSIRGRRTIRVDEWGPDDGLYPRLWMAPFEIGAKYSSFDITGPAGYIHIVNSKGVKLQAADNIRVPGSFLVDLEPETGRFIEFEYKGNRAHDSYGRLIEAGVPIRVKYNVPN